MISMLKVFLPILSGFITGLLKAHMENKAKQQEMLLAKAGFEEKTRQNARKMKGKDIAWTRRYIAVLFSTSFVGVFVTIILAGFFNPEISVNIPVEKYKNSFLSLLGFASPKVTTDYVTLKGMTLVYPFMEKLMILTEVIVGFYFGAKVKNK